MPIVARNYEVAWKAVHLHHSDFLYAELPEVYRCNLQVSEYDHNHTLQANPWQREEGTQSTFSRMSPTTEEVEITFSHMCINKTIKAK